MVGTGEGAFRQLRTHAPPLLREAGGATLTKRRRRTPMTLQLTAGAEASRRCARDLRVRHGGAVEGREFSDAVGRELARERDARHEGQGTAAMRPRWR